MAPTKRARGKTTPLPAPTRVTRSRTKVPLSADSDFDSFLGNGSGMDTTLEGIFLFMLSVVQQCYGFR